MIFTSGDWPPERITTCRYCGEGIGFARMPYGRWQAFDPRSVPGYLVPRWERWTLQLIDGVPHGVPAQEVDDGEVFVRHFVGCLTRPDLTSPADQDRPVAVTVRTAAYWVKGATT